MSLFRQLQDEQRQLEANPNPSLQEIQVALQNKKDFALLISKFGSLQHHNSLEVTLSTNSNKDQQRSNVSK